MNSVAHSEERGDVIVPANVGVLLTVDEHEETDEGNGEVRVVAIAIDHLVEQLAVHCHIEVLLHVHRAGEDIVVVPEEEVDGLNTMETFWLNRI